MIEEQESTPPPEGATPGWLALPKLQAFIGISAGMITILATGGSMLGISTLRAPVHGEVVASVSTARYRTPVRDAMVEILTPASAVVTTLNADDEGRVYYRLREGQYRLRVTHPQYAPDQKDVQVWAGQRADIRLALTTRTPPPKPVASAVPRPPAIEKRGF
jgi:hypothetical protein